MVWHVIFLSEWYIFRDPCYGRVYGPDPEPLMSYKVLSVQAFLILECFCDFCTDGGFTDSRFACYPPTVLGFRKGVCPLLNLAQHSFPSLFVAFSLFLLFPVVLGLWYDTVTECLLNELQSPVDLILRANIRLDYIRILKKFTCFRRSSMLSMTVSRAPKARIIVIC